MFTFVKTWLYVSLKTPEGSGFISSFKWHACSELVICEQRIIGGHKPQSSFLLDVRYLETNLHNPVIFVLL